MKFDLIKAIIFDYGGTIDTNGRHWANVLWEAYVAEELPINNRQFRDAYVYAERYLAMNKVVNETDDFYDLLKKKVDLELSFLVDEQIISPTIAKHSENIALRCNNYVLDNLQKSRPLLKRLSEKMPLILVSNFYGNIENVLEKYNLTFFSDIIESSVVGVKKPNPRIFELGVQSSNHDACNVVVVGDSIRKDIIPAKTIGCKTIWIKGDGWDINATEDESIPDEIITSIEQIENILF